ncbi:hypothetical protein Tco_0910633 [Tanacetum coccineum]|uniref:Uncharacterized protein n=1 Tax=Tanacetum coccineum TaxID=301880 RepID=A0ABQ5CWM8_9ASTR
MTESHHVDNRGEHEHPLDFDFESRNAEMFGITYKLTHHLMRNLTSFRCYFSIIEGLINHVQKIGNPISEAFKLYEDDLLIIARDKTNKRNAEDHDNDEHITERTEWFFYKLVTKKRKGAWRKKRLEAVMIAVQHQAQRMMNSKLHQRHKEFAEYEPKVSSRGFWDIGFITFNFM